MTSAHGTPRLPKAGEVVAAHLRERIIVGGLAPDSALPSESELTERFQFSRASVREGLRLLESDGLIYVKRGPGGGVRVKHPDEGHVSRSFALLFATRTTPLRDLVEFRRLLEPEAAAQAANHADTHRREALIEASGRSGRGEDEFHSVLARCVPNEILRVTLTAVQRLSDWHLPAEGFEPSEIEDTHKAHRRIALAVRRGDPADAARSMLRHIDGFAQALARLGRLDEPIVRRESWTNPSTS